MREEHFTCSKMIRQKELFVQMEQDFGIIKPIFLNIDKGWYDNTLCFAQDLRTKFSQGRYRVDLNTNSKGVQEFWFDIEWKNPKLKRAITMQDVNDHFPGLKEVTLRFLDEILKYIRDDCIYIKATSSGFQLCFFATNVKNMEQWKNITLYLIEEAQLKNTKDVVLLTYGVDRDATIASRHKIRDVGAKNTDKLETGERAFLHYTTYIPVENFFKLRKYPFCQDYQQICFPERYETVPLPKNLVSIKAKGKVCSHCFKSRRQSGNSEVALDYEKARECPAYVDILREKETVKGDTWRPRHYLIHYLKNHLRMSEGSIINLVCKYNCWSDFSSAITKKKIHEHFRSGHSSEKLKTMIRKNTLRKLGYCLKNCKICIYDMYMKAADNEDK